MEIAETSQDPLSGSVSLPPPHYFLRKNVNSTVKILNPLPDFPDHIKNGAPPSTAPLTIRPFLMKFLRFPKNIDVRLVPDLVAWCRTAPADEQEYLPVPLRDRLTCAIKTGTVEWCGFEMDFHVSDAEEVLVEICKKGYTGLSWWTVMPLPEISAALEPVACSGEGDGQQAFITWCSYQRVGMMYTMVEIVILVRIDEEEDIEKLCAEAGFLMGISKTKMMSFVWLRPVVRCSGGIVFAGTFDMGIPVVHVYMSLFLFGYDRYGCQPKKRLSPDRVKTWVRFRFCYLPATLAQFALEYEPSLPPNPDAHSNSSHAEKKFFYSALGTAHAHASSHRYKIPLPIPKSDLPDHLPPTLSPLSSAPTLTDSNLTCRWIDGAEFLPVSVQKDILPCIKLTE